MEPRKILDEMIAKAVKKTQRVPTTERGAAAALKRQSRRAERGQHRNPVIKGEDGEFRGGDPADIEIKKEEKELGKSYIPGAKDIPEPTNPSQRRSYKQTAAHALVNYHQLMLQGDHKRAKEWEDHAHRMSGLAGAGPTKKMVQAHAVSGMPEHYNTAVRQASIHPLVKAQPGEEVGAFRGGDPEEIRIKREEKMKEMEESGELEDLGEGEEEADASEIEEIEEEEKQKEEDKGKAIVTKAIQILTPQVMDGAQVSPVDTFGDYQPRDANGDLLTQKYANRHKDGEKYEAPGPVRAGDNQHRNWSEVIGVKVPLTGDPIQHLRRYWKQGQIGQMSKEAELLARSLEGETGILWCWRPDFYGGEFFKGMGDAPREGPHKYIKRWFEGGSWQYEYANEMHPEGHHGIQHSGRTAGHTLDINPSYFKKDKTPTPKEAYNYSRHMQVAEGGSYPVRIFDKKSGRIVDKVIHMPGSPKDEDGNFLKDEKGMPQLKRGSIQMRNPGSTTRRGAKSFTDIDAYEKAMVRAQVTTEHDAHGDPWLHWRTTGKGGGQPEMMHDPKSRLNANLEDAGTWKRSHSRTVDGLRDWIANQKSLQKRMKEEQERGSVHPSERASAKEWEPTEHHVFNLSTMQKEKHPETGEPLKAEMKTTNALERGDLGTWKWADKPTAHTVEGEYGPIRHYVRQGTELKFDNMNERNKVQEQVLKENYGPILGQARKILSSAGLLDNSNPHETQRKIAELMHHGFAAAFDRAANNYDPNHSSKARFSTFLVGQVKNEMQKHLPQLLGEQEKNRALALREHTRLSNQAKQLQETIASGKGTARHHSDLQRAQDQIQKLEGAYSLVPRGEKIGEGQQMRAPAQERREITARPKGSSRSYTTQRETGMSPEEWQGAGANIPTPEAALSAKQEAQQSMQSDWESRMAAEGMPAEMEYKSVSTLMTAAEILRKADDVPEADSPPAMKYLWREGEPGAFKHMWEAPNGNVVRGTNAPPEHPHHDPEAGPPQIHEHEPMPDTAPQMFDHHGRKLHRSVPEGVETEDNISYDPDSNHWAQKYQNPDSGGDEFIALHSDRVKNHRYSHNEDLRQLDAQLEKVRQWYDQMFQSEDLRTKAIGLAMALLDQAKMMADGEGSGLLSMRVSDVSMTGNVFKFTYKDRMGDKHMVSAVLDSASAAVLQALAQGKKPGDLLFDVEGQPITQQELAQMLDQQFGLSLRQFRVYHGSELFSKEFQRLASTHANLSPDDLHKIADQASGRVMRMMGHKKVDPEVAKQLYIDPIVIEALFMSAIHHHDDEINKAISDLLKGRKLHGRCTFQGLPVSIENRKGSKRSWYDPHNKQTGTTHMKHAYGYIRGTLGTDGDHVDVYLGPDKNAENVFVVHQKKAPDFKVFDEDKCMLGFSDGKAAKDAYMAQYDKPGFFGGMTSMPMEEFKTKVLATKRRPMMIKGQEEFKPHSPTSTTPSDPGYVYHATNEMNASDISGGHLHPHEPWHGTDQSAWPDGSTEKRSYWSDKAKHVHSFAPEEGKSVILRTKKADHFKTERGTGDVITTKPVHSDHMEIRHESGSWHPLNHAYGVKKSIKMCSACKSTWGSCECSKAIEKAFAGSADTGPVVWHVSVTHPERTPDETLFGDWIHSHPMHEHDQHWSAFKEATKVEDPPEPIHGREYAHGGDKPDEEDWDLEEEEHHPSSATVPAGEAPEGEEEAPEEVASPEGGEELQEPADVAKSLLAEMIHLAS